MPADLDQFRREYSHGAVIGGKGLIELSHMTPNARPSVNQINLKTRSGKIKRRLNTADPSTNNQYVSKITVRETLTELLYLFFFHFSISLLGFFGSLNNFLNDLRNVLNLQDFFALHRYPTIFKIGNAIRAGSNQHLSPDPHSLF